MNQETNQEMNDNNSDFSASLRDLANQSAAHTDKVLEEELTSLMNSTTAQLEALRPMISNPEDYERLIKAVAEATAENEKANQFLERLTQSGGGLLKIGLSAAKMLKGI